MAAADDIVTFAAGTASKGAGDALKSGFWSGLVAGGLTTLVGIGLSVAAMVTFGGPLIIAAGIAGIIGSVAAGVYAGVHSGLFIGAFGGAWGLLTGGYKAVKEKKEDQNLQMAQKAMETRHRGTEMQNTAAEMEQLAAEAERAAMTRRAVQPPQGAALSMPPSASQPSWRARTGQNSESEREKSFVERAREQSAASAAPAAGR